MILTGTPNRLVFVYPVPRPVGEALRDTDSRSPELTCDRAISGERSCYARGADSPPHADSAELTCSLMRWRATIAAGYGCLRAPATQAAAIC